MTTALTGELCITISSSDRTTEARLLGPRGIGAMQSNSLASGMPALVQRAYTSLDEEAQMSAVCIHFREANRRGTVQFQRALLTHIECL